MKMSVISHWNNSKFNEKTWDGCTCHPHVTCHEQCHCRSCSNLYSHQGAFIPLGCSFLFLLLFFFFWIGSNYLHTFESRHLPVFAWLSSTSHEKLVAETVRGTACWRWGSSILATILWWIRHSIPSPCRERLLILFSHLKIKHLSFSSFHLKFRQF